MRNGIIAVVLFWFSIVGVSFWVNLLDEKQEHKQLAFETARALFQQVVITRAWNAGHGGVYVPVTDRVQPNPYLDDPLRDIVSSQGVRLTKINPAYMTRQIAEIAAGKNGIKFHITSLEPLRPQNEATGWEKEWLESFEKGALEQGAFWKDANGLSFRYMAPLMVEKSCLLCHAGQGYSEGEIRGGISITVPYPGGEKYTVMILGYGITVIAGLIFILAGGLLLERKRVQLVRSNESLSNEIEEREKLISQLRAANRKIKTLSGIVPICMYCKEIRDDKGYWNQLERFITQHSSALFSHSICPKCMKEKHPGVDLEDD